jgi:hypothetical protein
MSAESARSLNSKAREVVMRKRFPVIAMLFVVCLAALAIERHHGILEGVVLKLDFASHTVVVKLADGTEHTLHFVKRTTVHGAQDTVAGAKEAFHGLKEGSEVAVHYTAKGTEETAEEIDNIGKDGLKSTEATVTHIDCGAKTLAVKTADGAEQTYRLTDNAAKDADTDISESAEKSRKIIVYYTEEGGQKIAHFFKWSI